MSDTRIYTRHEVQVIALISKGHRKQMRMPCIVCGCCWPYTLYNVMSSDLVDKEMQKN